MRHRARLPTRRMMLRAVRSSISPSTASGSPRSSRLSWRPNLESLTPQQFRELLEDFADAQAARESLAEVEAGAEPVPAEQVWAELGLGT